MSDEDEKLAITVSRLTMAIAACFQGLDMLSLEERSSKEALSLLTHALQNMQFRPMPDSQGREFESNLLAKLQSVTEGPSMWVEGLSPDEVVH